MQQLLVIRESENQRALKWKSHQSLDLCGWGGPPPPASRGPPEGLTRGRRNAEAIVPNRLDFVERRGERERRAPALALLPGIRPVRLFPFFDLGIISSIAHCRYSTAVGERKTLKKTLPPAQAAQLIVLSSPPPLKTCKTSHARTCRPRRFPRPMRGKVVGRRASGEDSPESGPLQGKRQEGRGVAESQKESLLPPTCDVLLPALLHRVEHTGVQGADMTSRSIFSQIPPSPELEFTEAVLVPCMTSASRPCGWSGGRRLLSRLGGGQDLQTTGLLNSRSNLAGPVFLRRSDQPGR